MRMKRHNKISYELYIFLATSDKEVTTSRKRARTVIDNDGDQTRARRPSNDSDEEVTTRRKRPRPIVDDDDDDQPQLRTQLVTPTEPGPQLLSPTENGPQLNDQSSRYGLPVPVVEDSVQLPPVPPPSIPAVPVWTKLDRALRK